MPDHHLATPILKSAVKLVVWDLDDPERVRKSALRPYIPAFNADEIFR